MQDICERIILFNKHLLPEMVRYKYKAMLENAFRFYRGTCHLFYEDLSKAEIIPSPNVWICGDLHLENFGSYKADNKLVYFDLNDFDESLLAPAAYELLRLVCSIFIAFETLNIEPAKADKMARLFLKSYAATLAKGKTISIDPRTAKGIVRDFLESAQKNKPNDLLKKRTSNKRKKLVLSLKHEKHFKIEKQLKKQLADHINTWIKKSSDGPYNFKVQDVAFRLAGTGSIGIKRYLFLLKSTNVKDDYLLVDMKQSTPSSLLPYTNIQQPEWETEATRIITIQQRMQNVSSSLLSTTVFNGEAYILQELQPVKDSINFNLIRDQYRDIYQVIDDMAILTASAQIRSGGIQGSAIIDELSAFGQRTDWQEPLLNYASNYAWKVKADFNIYKKSYRKGVFNIYPDKK